MKLRRNIEITKTKKNKIKFVYKDEQGITSTVSITNLTLEDTTSGELIKMFYIFTKFEDTCPIACKSLGEALRLQKRYEKRINYKPNIYK